MSTIGLSPEQRRLVEQAGDEPVRIDDPDTREAYILVKEGGYRRLITIDGKRRELGVRTAGWL
jgi:hypothetical protein